MSHFTNTACEIGCRMWRSSRCGRATTLFAKLLKQTTSNYFTKSNLSVTVSQRHRQLSAARCGRATTLFAKLPKQTTSNYFTKSNLSVTVSVSQRHRHLSEEIFYDSLGIGIQIRGGAKSISTEVLNMFFFLLFLYKTMFVVSWAKATGGISQQHRALFFLLLDNNTRSTISCSCVGEMPCHGGDWQQRCTWLQGVRRV